MSDESENSLSPYLLAVMSEEYLRMRCCSGEDYNANSCPERSIKVSSSNHQHDIELSSDFMPTNTRSKYTPAQQKEIIRIFKNHHCHDDAMKEINGIPEFERVQKRKVIRWIQSSNSGAIMGRPISKEFESEVLIEVKEKWKPSMGSFNAFVTKSATTVFNREYWSEEKQAFCVKKWKEEKSTRSLKFTTRWVEGWIKRANFMLYANKRAGKNLSSTDSDQSSFASSSDGSSCSRLTDCIDPLLLSAHR